MLQELRTSLDQNGKSLTVAVSADAALAADAYDIPSINGIVDRIHLTSYDFHGAWEKYTHHHSNLESYPQDDAGNATLNVVSVT